jgi:hypothetical protein
MFVCRLRRDRRHLRRRRPRDRLDRVLSAVNSAQWAGA